MVPGPQPAPRRFGRTLGEVHSKFHLVDDPGVERLAEHDLSLRLALGIARPENWWGTGIAGDRLLTLVIDEGLPLCWVPRQSIVIALAGEPTGEARRVLLLKRASDVLDDCEAVVAHAGDPWLAELAPLALESIRAWRNGYRAAAATLAVATSEKLALQLAEPFVNWFDSKEDAEAWHERRRTEKNRYDRAKRLTRIDATVPLSPFLFRGVAALAPINRFFEAWWPSSGAPVPDALSRHVVVHQPSASYLQGAPSLIAVMLAASLLREMVERCDEIHSMDRAE